jgi:hypothetical protein
MNILVEYRSFILLGPLNACKITGEDEMENKNRGKHEGDEIGSRRLEIFLCSPESRS